MILIWSWNDLGKCFQSQHKNLKRDFPFFYSISLQVTLRCFQNTDYKPFFHKNFRIMAFKSYNTALASFKVYRVEIARSDLRFSLSFSHFISCTLIIITYVYALLHLYFSLILILIEWRHCERQLNGWNALYVCHTYHWKICESEWSLFGTRSLDLGVGCINFVRMVVIKKYL